MKLRIRGNSIRLRLTQGEVDRVAQGKSVEEEAVFGPRNTFRYRLLGDANAEQTGAEFEGGVLTVRVPAEALSQWAGTDQVGIEGEQHTDGATLKLLIEKDFTCLEPRDGGEDHDTFPNPQKCG